MRYDTAVSEILGAVFLIGLVVIAFSIIGVMLFTNTPTTVSNNPVATTGSHCVKCAEKWYELYVTHDGGEPYQQDELKFKVNYEDKPSEDAIPVAVYNGQPSECVGSSHLDTYAWAGQGGTGTEQFVSGQVLQFTLEDLPQSLIITDVNNNPIDTFSYDAGGVPVFKDLTNTTSTDPFDDIGWDTVNNTPTGVISPVLKPNTVVGPDDDGFCTVTFYYDNSLGVRMKATPCAGNPVIMDSQGNVIGGQDNCAKPWNEFIGVGSPGSDFAYLRKNMGQPTIFEPNEKEGQSMAQRSFMVKFKNGIKWRLGNSYSIIASCDAGPLPDSCGPNEAYMYGYMFYDLNMDGVKDSDEPGFTDGRINLVGRYKNNPNVEFFEDTYTPKQTGVWQSRCIHMSGWAYDLTAVIPAGYSASTPLEYLNYDEKFTGQEKHHPPRIDFGVYLTGSGPTPEPTAVPTTLPPTPATPTPTPTVIPIDSGGVGDVLYAADGSTDVIVEFAFSDAGYENVFRLDNPTTLTLGNSKTTQVGTSWNLGTFTAGQELVFADAADGKTYKSGPASRNPDNVVHAAISLKESNPSSKKYLVTFEDFWEGGDEDYNDVEFYVSGNVYTLAAPTPTPTPTPAPTIPTPLPTATPAPTEVPPADVTPPVVSISSPVAGVNWAKHTTHAITWTATDALGVTRIVIKLSTDDGATYSDTLLDTTTNTGSHNWYVPANRKTSNARIKVTAYDAEMNPGNAVSGKFTIS